jgi:transposase
VRVVERIRRKRTIYTDQFRTDAVDLLRRTDRTLTQVAADLGIPLSTLREWYLQDEMAKKSKGTKKDSTGVPAAEPPEQRLARLERENEKLRKENESLRMDREILKKAAAFFAKESE